jgi:hypothetical protein
MLQSEHIHKDTCAPTVHNLCFIRIRHHANDIYDYPILPYLSTLNVSTQHSSSYQHRASISIQHNGRSQLRRFHGGPAKPASLPRATTNTPTAPSAIEIDLDDMICSPSRFFLSTFNWLCVIPIPISTHDHYTNIDPHNTLIPTLLDTRCTSASLAHHPLCEASCTD